MGEVAGFSHISFDKKRNGFITIVHKLPIFNELTIEILITQ
jgi:hypothetical protein